MNNGVHRILLLLLALPSTLSSSILPTVCPTQLCCLSLHLTCSSPFPIFDAQAMHLAVPLVAYVITKSSRSSSRQGLSRADRAGAADADVEVSSSAYAVRCRTTPPPPMSTPGSIVVVATEALPAKCSPAHCCCRCGDGGWYCLCWWWCCWCCLCCCCWAPILAIGAID